MEVHIQHEQSLVLERFSPNVNIVLPDGTTSIGFTRKARLPPVPVTQVLLDRLLFAGLEHKVKVGQSIAGLEVCLGFQGNSGPRQFVSAIQLTGVGHFLQSLFGRRESHCLEEAKVLLEVTEIKCTRSSGATPDRLIKLGQESLLFSPGLGETKRFKVATTTTTINTMEQLVTNWSLGTWTIDVYVKLVPSQSRTVGVIGDVRNLAVQDLLAANRRMLTDEVFPDTTVISENGAEIKFHRSILAAHSPTFERMFQTKMQEEATGVLELPDMSEEGVRALKEYLYIWDLKAAQRNSLVCFELFEAGHKYGISTLEDATFQIFMRMGGDWYSAAVALRLFLMVKELELPRLKQKAVEILKLKRTELKTLDEYHDLYKKKNVAVAMELTESLASP